MQAFETERLQMRLLKTSDETLYTRCYTDPILMQYIGTPLSDNAVLNSFSVALKRNAAPLIHRLTWVMLEKKSDSDIGLLALICDHSESEPTSAEIGAIILTGFQSRGYAAEAIAALVKTTFENTAIARLSTRHTSRNGAANGLMNKLGFQRTEADASLKWLLNRADWQMRRNRPL
jgi:RimJ/RimL family protein N-acetyltransferase